MEFLSIWDFEGFRRWVSENSQKSCAAVRQSATLIQTTDRWNNQMHNVDERENYFWRDKPVFEGGLSKRSQTRWHPRPIHLSSSEPVCFCLPSPTEFRVVESELSERNPAFQDPANSRRSQNNTKPNQRVPGNFLWVWKLLGECIKT